MAHISTQKHILYKALVNNSIILFSIIFFIPTAVFSQSLTIGARSFLVMNGTSSLVTKDAAFINNGSFSEGKGTVKFTGYADTTTTYLGGTSSTTFYNLTSNKTAYGIALKSMAKVRNVLNVSAGHLYCDSNLTLLSDADLTARVDVIPSGSNIYGKAMVQRFIPGRRAWRLMTAPVTNSNTILNTWQNGKVYEAGKGTFVTGASPSTANGLDESPQNNVSMKKFNYLTQAFTNVTNTKIAISSGNSGNADNDGYFMFVRGDRLTDNFNYSTGACNTTVLTSMGQLQTHTQTFNVSKDSAKYTMLGNPYASPIDFNALTRNNVVKRFFVFDPTLGTAGSWVIIDDIDGDGTFTKSIGTSAMNQYIQSGQAFFVITNGNVASASVTFEETHKSSIANNTVMGRPAAPLKISSLRSNLYITDADTAYITDGVLTEFNNMFSAKTTLEDASKISNSNENLTLLRNGLGFSMERRPMLTDKDTVFFKIFRFGQKKYRLEFIPSYLTQTGLQGFMEDSYLKTSVPVSLSSKTSIDFNVNSDAASSAEGRFKIVFRPLAIPLPVTISSIKATMLNTKHVTIEWKVENEINIIKYEVERSVDGISFKTIDIKNVVGLNSTSSIYNLLDVAPIEGNNYYRIKSIDANGQFKYSQIVKVALDGSQISSINIYPNTIKNNMINLQLNNQMGGLYNVRLINSDGRLIFKKEMTVSKGNSNQVLKPISSLSSGVYQLEIINTDKQKTLQKLIVE
ncbi:MAG: T9SS type A sorting domain-containing protein [Bacteroidota bacterium]